jgi:hypothetical protein
VACSEVIIRQFSGGDPVSIVRFVAASRTGHLHKEIISTRVNLLGKEMYVSGNSFCPEVYFSLPFQCFCLMQHRTILSALSFWEEALNLSHPFVRDLITPLNFQKR